MARNWRQIRFWLAGAVLALLISCAIFGLPRRLAIGERLDPLSRAESLISRGAYGKALGLLSRMDVKNLDSWEVRKIRLQRAVCQKMLGQSAEAQVAFQRLMPGFEKIRDYLLFWQGECFDAQGKSDSAAVAYLKVAKVRPPSPLRDEAVLRAADLRLASGDAASAVGLYRRLVGASGQEARALGGLGQALEAVRDSSGARRVQLQLLREYPDSPEALDAVQSLAPLQGVEERFYGGMAYAANGQSRSAARMFREIIRISSDRNWEGRAQYELGKLYFDRKAYRTAEQAFRTAYRTYRVPKALFEMARCSSRMDRDLEAAGRFQAFARFYPSVSGADEALWNAGMAYERQNHYRKARELFLELSVRYPQSEFADHARWRAGFVQYKQREYLAAAHTFLDLARTTSEDYLRDQGEYWAGKCFGRLGRPKDREHWLKQASTGFPVSYYSARARAVLGVTGEGFPSVPDSITALKRAPYKPSRYALRGDLLASLGLYRLAEQEYVRAEQVQGNNLSALGDLLQRYERIGAMNRALRVSGRMLALERKRGLPTTLVAFRRLYPTYYWGEVSQTAQHLDLDPGLILAIIRQESAFNDQAMSPVGAMGLMQVMPKTGRTLAREVRMKHFSVADLWNPETCIRLGSRHLSDHLRYFRSQDRRQLGLALSAYNAGLAAARRWSRQLPNKDVDEFVESIPYRETRNYVKLVYRNYQVYSYLLGEDQPGAESQME